MVIDVSLLLEIGFSNFQSKYAAMKNILIKACVIFFAFAGWIVLGSWSGGPAPERAKDSLAIIRVVKPINEFFKVKPAVFVSTGCGQIEQVKMSDADYGNGDFVLKQTLTDFLSNGYTIQTATETAESGMQLNTY